MSWEREASLTVDEDDSCIIIICIIRAFGTHVDPQSMHYYNFYRVCCWCAILISFRMHMGMSCHSILHHHLYYTFSWINGRHTTHATFLAPTGSQKNQPSQHIAYQMAYALHIASHGEGMCHCKLRSRNRANMILIMMHLLVA